MFKKFAIPVAADCGGCADRFRPVAATARPAGRPARSPVRSARTPAVDRPASRRRSRSAGKLVVGVNPPYSPNEYLDSSGKLVGFDVDLMDATAKVLGLTTHTPRPTSTRSSRRSPPAPTTSACPRSPTTRTARRRSTSPTYFSAGILWASRFGKTVDPDNACGLTVAVQTTTTEDTDDIPARSKACTDAGKPAINKLQFDSQDDATNAVDPRQSRRDVGRLAGHRLRDQAERRQAAGRRLRSPNRRRTAGRWRRARPWPRRCKRRFSR